MRVLHIITGLAAGGAEHQLRLLLRNHRHPAEVAVLTNPGSVARAIRADGTTVHEVAMRANTDLRAMPRLVRIIRSGGFDVVHTHLYRAAIHGRVGARLAGVRHVVATEHSLGDRLIEGRRASQAVRALYLATERLGDVTIAVSATVARRLQSWGVPASRIEIIPNGIDVDSHRFNPQHRDELRQRLQIPPDRLVVGAVGRLASGKNIDLLLHAASGQPGLRVLIIGDGPQRPALTRLAAMLAVDAHFVGESEDVPRLLSAMDLLVSTSSEETFGLAVIEALAAGLPVLYVSCPALEDMPPGSAPEAQRLPPDERALRRALAEAVRSGPRRHPVPPAVHHFDIVGLAPRIEAVYTRVVAADAIKAYGPIS